MRLIRFLKTDLAGEINQWVASDIISQDQARTLFQRYDITASERDATGLGYRIMLVAGFLFLGIASLILLGHNWDEIPRSLRVAGLLLSTAGINAAGARAWFQSRDALATGLLTLGAIFYGASIMLIAQIYHLGEHFPDGVWLWAIGVLPVALITSRRTLLAMAGVLATVWLFLETDRGQLCPSYLVFIGAFIWHLCYQGRSLILCSMLIIGTGCYVQTLGIVLFSTNFLFVGAENVVMGIAYMMMLFAVARWLKSHPGKNANDYGVLLDIWLLRFSILTLLIFSYRYPWASFSDATWEHPWLLSIGFALSAVASLAVWISARPKLDRYFGLLAAAVTLLTGLVFASSTGSVDIKPEWMQFITAGVLLALGMALVFKGLEEAVTHYYFTGILVFLGFAVTRYFELIGDYITTSLLFAGSAAVLIVCARFWRARQLSDTGVIA